MHQLNLTQSCISELFGDETPLEALEALETTFYSLPDKLGTSNPISEEELLIIEVRV